MTNPKTSGPAGALLFATMVLARLKGATELMPPPLMPAELPSMVTLVRLKVAEKLELIPPPKVAAEFPLIVLLTIDTVPLPMDNAPPPAPELLPLKVVFWMVSATPGESIAPPLLPAVLLLKVQSERIKGPAWLGPMAWRAPPWKLAWLSVKTQSISVREVALPSRNRPAPLPAALSVMVSPEMLTVAGKTWKTRLALLPLIASWSAPRPLMVRSLLTASSPLVRTMVPDRPA